MRAVWAWIQAVGRHGWVDAAFSSGFLTLMGLFAWPAWYAVYPPFPALTPLKWALPPAIAIVAIGGEDWGRRMRLGVLWASLILWLGALRGGALGSDRWTVLDQTIAIVAMTVVLGWTAWTRARDR